MTKRREIAFRVDRAKGQQFSYENRSLKRTDSLEDINGCEKASEIRGGRGGS